MTSLTETLNSSARKWRKRAAIEHAGHADDHVMRQAGKLAQRPDHRVERVGDADDERVRRIGLDAFADRLHHLQIDAEQIVAAHPRLAGDTGGDDDDIGAGDIGVIIGALEVHIEPFDRAALRQIERLALRHAFDHVEQHDIAESLGSGEMRQRATDVASADQRNFVASHGESDPSLESLQLPRPDSPDDGAAQPMAAPDEVSASPVAMSQRHVVRRLHLHQPRNGAFELEDAIAGRVQLLRRRHRPRRAA